MQAMKQGGGELLPIDSEHNAIFQCLPSQFTKDANPRLGVEELWLTASGGPFRNTPLEQLASITPEQACAHPNWVMGRKISVDSATMMNKGLEVIEAPALCAYDKGDAAALELIDWADQVIALYRPDLMLCGANSRVR